MVEGVEKLWNGVEWMRRDERGKGGEKSTQDNRWKTKKKYKREKQRKRETERERERERGGGGGGGGRHNIYLGQR